MKKLTLVFSIMMLLITGCSDDDDEVTCFTCLYEQRNTSCGSSEFGPWEEGSAIIDFEIRDDLTPESFCLQAYPANDIECGGGCCLSFQFRDVRVGSCQ